MGELYKCTNCGGITKDKGHLCNPQPVHDKCAYCGGMTESARHVCEAKRQNLDWVCDSCGRLADSPDLLCQPAKVPASA